MKLNLNEVKEYVERHISIFHQKRLEYVSTTIELDKILKQKNPYLFKAKNILTAQDLVKGFLDAFLQSQEETLFGEFIEGLATFVCSRVHSGKKSELTGIDLEFLKDGIIYIVEVKAGWNWGNASQIKQLKINFRNAKKILEKQIGKKVIAINGCCFGKKKNRNPEKDGYYKICGQEFWELISGTENFYIDIIEPIGHRAKQKNEEFLEAYAVVVNKFTLDFAQRFCIDGKIDWKKFLKFNSGQIKEHK
jgi:hypothetical protein